MKIFRATSAAIRGSERIHAFDRSISAGMIAKVQYCGRAIAAMPAVLAQRGFPGQLIVPRPRGI
jgi:hypothetical protein